MTPERLTVTVPEAAAVLGIGRDSCYAAVQRGEIPSLRIGRRVVIPAAQLRALLGLQSEAAPATGAALTAETTTAAKQGRSS